MQNKSIKIALFFTYGMSFKDWYLAGYYIRDSLLYNKLCEIGHEVYFVTYGDKTDSEYLPKDSKIKLLTRPARMSKLLYAYLIPFIHRKVLKGIDLIKSHQLNGARYAVLAKSVYRKPYVARCGYLISVFAAHEGITGYKKVKIDMEERLAFSAADAACVPWEGEIDYVTTRYGLRREKFYACPNWVDTEQFKPDKSVKKQPGRICFIGRLHPQKQPMLLLEAIKNLDNIELLMIGKGHLKSQIEEKCKEYKINATLIDYASNESLPGYLNSSSIYILPTRYEGGSPKTLLEAMACGLPVVSTDAFGVDEAFEHMIHGFKCKVDDVNAMADAIKTLLTNHELRQQLGNNSRSHVLETYSIEKALERELVIYDQLLKAKQVQRQGNGKS